MATAHKMFRQSVAKTGQTTQCGLMQSDPGPLAVPHQGQQ